MNSAQKNVEAIAQLGHKLGIDSEGEIEEEQELIKMTDPHELMRNLQEKLPE